jgi:hypothetical protein
LASRLDQFPVTPRRAQRSYPWHQWTDGGTWMLVRGEDFDLEIEIFRNHKEQAEAAQDGVEKDREVLFVQFYGHTTA